MYIRGMLVNYVSYYCMLNHTVVMVVYNNSLNGAASLVKREVIGKLYTKGHPLTSYLSMCGI